MRRHPQGCRLNFLFRKLYPINIQKGCVVAHVTTSYHARFVSKNLPDSLVKACQVRWWKLAKFVSLMVKYCKTLVYVIVKQYLCSKFLAI